VILADAYDAFLFDLDGVIWRGEDLIDGADETIARLREMGKRTIFCTNNSSRIPRDYAMKLARFKIPTSNDDIVTSGQVVVAELERLGLVAGDKIHILAGEGMARMLNLHRFIPVDTEDPKCKAVVVGWNLKSTFEDVRRAANLMRAGVPGIAANRDATYPAEHGLLPGTGAMVAALELASGRECTVVGKPAPGLYRMALERADVEPSRALFVGDRAETDILGARNAGVPSALVLTGITTERELGLLPSVPDHILDSVQDIVRDLPAPHVERRDNDLVAVDGQELARVRMESSGGGVVLRDLHVQGPRGEAAWRAVRRLLAEAVAGAEFAEVGPELRPYLERLGVDADSQLKLFGASS
jgi:4-nitrophenyl phosphatase